MFSTVGGFQFIFGSMKNRSFLIIILLLFSRLHEGVAQTEGVPFSISLEEITYEHWPALHSFAYGTWEGRWILAGGRTDGLHSFLPPDVFPVSQANTNIIMLDPETGDVWYKSVSALLPAYADQLKSTNPQYVQVGKYLYFMGGFGLDSASGNKITFPSMIAIDLDMLDDLMIDDADISPAFRKLDDSLFRVAGGEAEFFNNMIYLFGGHIFTGEYTKIPSPTFTQQYTNELIKFKLDDDGETITISDIEIYYDSLLFHRRDLNLEPIMLPGGEEQLAAYSGVFQYDADLPWPHTLYFTADSYYQDEIFIQKYNNYTCPVLTMFDSVSGYNYSTFFGGFSQYAYDEISGTEDEDLNIPFVNDITTISRNGTTSEQFLLPVSFDALLGGNAIFVTHDSIAQYENGIIQLHALSGVHEVGYVYGGIVAEIPNFTPSAASNRLFTIKVTYFPPTPQSVSALENNLYVFPNPAENRITIRNMADDWMKEINLYNGLGDIVLRKECNQQQQHLDIDVTAVTPGIYLMHIVTGSSVAMKKIVIH